jgi:hypothetical protein
MPEFRSAWSLDISGGFRWSPDRVETTTVSGEGPGLPLRPDNDEASHFIKDKKKATRYAWGRVGGSHPHLGRLSVAPPSSSKSPSPPADPQPQTTSPLRRHSNGRCVAAGSAWLIALSSVWMRICFEATKPTVFLLSEPINANHSSALPRVSGSGAPSLGTWQLETRCVAPPARSRNCHIHHARDAEASA